MKENFKKELINYDACQFPPCKVELNQQILRALYVSNIWQNVFDPKFVVVDPVQFRWKIADVDTEGSSLTFQWFEGDQFPPKVTNI